jgi:hypothetical protein
VNAQEPQIESDFDEIADEDVRGWREAFGPWVWEVNLFRRPEKR